MRMFRIGLPLLGALAILIVLSLFTVDEREKALLLRLGEVVRVHEQAGLYFKVPFINNVRRFDGRVQTLNPPPERYLTSEKKNVIVEAFVKWRVSDPVQYLTTMGGDSNRANMRLEQILKDGLRAEFGKRTIQEVVSGERTIVMESITEKTEDRARDFGISIKDVRIKRIDLPRDV